MSVPFKVVATAGAGLALTGGGGFLAATAISASSQAAVTTTTINAFGGPTGPTGVAGPKGDTGPIGPQGPAGNADCPAGFQFGNLVINHPGGQTIIFTCIKS